MSLFVIIMDNCKDLTEIGKEHLDHEPTIDPGI